MQLSALTCLWVLLLGVVQGQYFDLEQVSQLYRPRMVWDAGWNAPSPLIDTTSHFSSFRTGFSASVPLRTRLGVHIAPDFSSLKLKDILKNSVQVKASQLMAGFRVGYGNVTPGFTMPPRQDFGYASASILGLHLDRHYRILFYSIGLGLSEASFKNPGVNYSGILGRMHLRGVRKMYFYGIALVGTASLPLPVPFLGGAFPLSKAWSLRITLPVSMELRYQRKGFIAGAGLRFIGQRTGLTWNGDRAAFTYAGLQLGISAEQKIGHHLQLFASAGFVTPGQVMLGMRSDPIRQYSLQGGPFVQGGVRMFFGRSIWGNILQKLEMD